MPQRPDDEESRPICSSCNGSGEGLTEDSTCIYCRGTGELSNRDDEDYYCYDYMDEEDYNDFGGEA